MAVGTLDGQKVLVKAPDETIFKRFRAFVGPVEMANYTVEADVRGTTRRRQMTDIGITAQRYSLVLYGNAQQLKIEPWEPETQRSVVVPSPNCPSMFHPQTRTVPSDLSARG